MNICGEHKIITMLFVARLSVATSDNFRIGHSRLLVMNKTFFVSKLIITKTNFPCSAWTFVSDAFVDHIWRYYVVTIGRDNIVITVVSKKLSNDLLQLLPSFVILTIIL